LAGRVHDANLLDSKKKGLGLTVGYILARFHLKG
jgi:hypothetical protein